MSRDLVIGIDSSTTACKAIVWDKCGRPVAEGRCAITTDTPRPGWHEQNAHDWWQALCVAVQQALRQTDPHRLAGLAIAHQRETFVPVDGRGEPLCPAILWMDERPASLLPEIAGLVDRERFHQVTGKTLSVNLTFAKIAWLQRFEAHIFADTAFYCDVHAFLVWRLTGKAHTGWGCACPTGLFDLRHRVWAVELLSLLGVHAGQLPPASPPGTVLGSLTLQAAQATGLPGGLPVIAGLGDGQAAGLGVNITQKGEAYLALGTSVITGTFSEDYLTGQAFRTMIGGRAYLLETVLLSGGYTLNWLRSFLGVNETISQESLDEQAAAIPPGSNGLMLVPYWNSVLGPYWDAHASGITIGWRGIHRPAHLYRAILEGVAFEQRLNTEGVEAALGSKLEHFLAVGGGANNDLWLQIIADISGKQVWRATSHEAAALGAGILAATGAGLYADVNEAAKRMTQRPSTAFLPDAARHDNYSRLYQEVYCKLFPALQPMLDTLANLTLPAATSLAV